MDLQIDLHAPEKTTCWADATDDNDTADSKRKSTERRCWADDSECLSPEFAPINMFPPSTTSRASASKRLDLGPSVMDYDDTPHYNLEDLHPPYNVFVGGLSFEINENTLAQFFTNHKCKVAMVRLPKEDPKKGKGGRSKGFGYVEFSDAQSLQIALAQNGAMLKNRKIKVDIADRDDRPSTKKGGRRKGDSRDSWAPKELPRNSKNAGGKGSSGQGKGGRGLANNTDWYDTTWNTSGRGGGYSSGGAGSYVGYGTGGASGYGTGNSYDFPLKTPEAPAQRVPLKLKPKTVADPGTPKSTIEPVRKKVDPFGGAKPRDEGEYERRRASQTSANVGNAVIMQNVNPGPPPPPIEPAPMNAQYDSSQYPLASEPPYQPQVNFPNHQSPKPQTQEQTNFGMGKDKKKNDPPIADTYVDGGEWEGAGDWGDWNAGGWNESQRPTPQAPRAKGGGGARSGKGKKGGRAGKRFQGGGKSADRDMNWRN